MLSSQVQISCPRRTSVLASPTCINRRQAARRIQSKPRAAGGSPIGGNGTENSPTGKEVAASVNNNPSEESQPSSMRLGKTKGGQQQKADPKVSQGPHKASASPASPEEEVERQKVQLLAAVASLDRGLAANAEEAHEVDLLAQGLEAEGGPVVLTTKTSVHHPNESPMDWFNGTWRLIYSSAFNTGNLGGSRPGPPAALVPTTLGQVYQRVDMQKQTLDNIVELLLPNPLPRWLRNNDGKLISPYVRLTLQHDYQVVGSNTVEITYQETFGEVQGVPWLGGLTKTQFPSLPEFLRPPKSLRSASFNVTFLDATMRVTRGDRGELRVYLKDQDLEPASSRIDYED